MKRITDKINKRIVEVKHDKSIPRPARQRIKKELEEIKEEIKQEGNINKVIVKPRAGKYVVDVISDCMDICEEIECEVELDLGHERLVLYPDDTLTVGGYFDQLKSSEDD